MRFSCGQEMLLSAACGQDLCLIGPKGEGKTFLAQQLASPDVIASVWRRMR